MKLIFFLDEDKPKHLTCDDCNITEASVKMRWYNKKVCDDCDDRFLTEKDM